MNIFYVSTLCTEESFKELMRRSIQKPQQQVQKFHKLFVEGLMGSVNSIYVMSRPPSNILSEEKVFTTGVKEIENDVTYHYLKIVEKPVIKHLVLLISGFISAIKWNFKYRKQERVIICDVLNLSISVSALLMSKICGIRSVGIVTDIPNCMISNQITSPIKRLITLLFNGISTFFMYQYDSYVLLTEKMNGLINPSDKPYIIIEGMADCNIKNTPNVLQDKYDEKVLIYAGGLCEENGMGKLIKAFMRLDDENVMLWIFGAGEMEDDIKDYEKQDNRIKYFGAVLNEKVLEEQIKATLLINPRPSNQEFTKYSFPSKNMEYMASGTPTLTTKLPGMPEEYDEYVYLFEDETIEGMKKTLEVILAKTKEELHEKGQKAKGFVLREKNNIVQAKKILDMLNQK